MKGKLVLENGKVFEGEYFGSLERKIGEIFFTTSMVGYQDLLSDPSYYGKIACMSYPLIGNYGLTDEDYDFKNIFIRGYIVKENNDLPSNFRSIRTLSDAMEENHVAGLSGIDTRELVKIIRDEGVMKALITTEEESLDDCLKALNEYQEEKDQVEKVSCKKMWYSRTANPSHTIVLLDLGVKTTLVKSINEYGLNVVVVPYDTTIDQIKKLKPSGVIVSHGPGNPNNYEDIVSLINQIKGKYPLLGLGLGCELIALSYNAKVNKMKSGHHGANLPVRNLKTNKIDITSQNHLYALDLNGIDELEITHKNVVDGDIEGYVDSKNKVIGVQYLIQETLNPEEDVINRLINIMKK